jgi:5-methylcytosine-specific restriction enzyme A
MTKRKEFTKSTKLAAYARSGGYCENEDCGLEFTPSNPAEYDHVVEAFYEGSNSLDNCRVLCRECHRAKTGGRAKTVAKSRRLSNATKNIRPKRQGFRGWRKFNGDIVWKA